MRSAVCCTVDQGCYLTHEPLLSSLLQHHFLSRKSICTCKAKLSTWLNSHDWLDYSQTTNWWVTYSMHSPLSYRFINWVPSQFINLCHISLSLVIFNRTFNHLNHSHFVECTFFNSSYSFHLTEPYANTKKTVTFTGTTLHDKQLLWSRIPCLYSLRGSVHYLLLHS